MADIINTLRGPRFLEAGSIKCPKYIIPIRGEDFTATGLYSAGFDSWQGHTREEYLRGADGEWHFERSYRPEPIIYPLIDEWRSLPEGV